MGTVADEQHSSTQEQPSSYIKVCVRIRPLTRAEFKDVATTPSKSNNLKQKRRESALQLPILPRKTVAMLDERVLIFDPSDVNKEFVKGVPTHDNKRTRDIHYAFDQVFPETATQSKVYDGAVKDLLDGVMDGINATVFAYGATGAGKTHTISGSKGDPGIMPLCMLDLFDKIKSSEHDNLIDITVSYLEVYNETIRDLLNPSSSMLDLREDSNNQVVIAGLSQHSPATYEEIMELLDIGSSNRTQSSTKANEASSRSHAIFQINVQQRDKNSGISANIKSATLTLCDLAGSERASVTDNRGQLLREGANINKSLLALGNCINALCDSKKSLQHIPFRDSKLTRLLKYSLGGNCRTVMIANVSPALCHYEETHNTLKYAWRAKKIKLNIQKNSIDVQYHIGQYADLISNLQGEISNLRAELAKKSKSTHVQLRNMASTSECSQEFVNEIVDYLKMLDEQIITEKSEEWTEIFDEAIKLMMELKFDKNAIFNAFRQFKTCSDEMLKLMNLGDLKQKLLCIQLKSFVNILEISPLVETTTADDKENDIKSEKKPKKPRRKSFIPLPLMTSIPETLNNHSKSSFKPRRQSLIPKSLPQSSEINRSFLFTRPKKEYGIDENVENNGNLNEELAEIDSFLNKCNENEDGKKRYNLRSQTGTPRKSMANQPLLRTPRELRTFVMSAVKNSPQLSAVPFSPARSNNLRY